MEFVAGFFVWIVIAIAGGFVFWALYRGPETDRTITYAFSLLGAAVGGMLGASAYIWHDPNPLRLGAVVGAILGAALFPWIYHFAAKRAL